MDNFVKGRMRVHYSLTLIGVFIAYGYSYTCPKTSVNLIDLKEVVIGRCEDYQNVINQDIFCKTGTRNCTRLWELFSTSFVNSSDCNVSTDAFTPFIIEANHSISGKQLFWSGLSELAHRYSNAGKRYVTLEDTFIGYMVNQLTFCGNATSNASNCPEYNSSTCQLPAVSSFWEAASKHFASSASGHIYALLNASRDPIIRNNSYFGRIEIPNLQRAHVKKMTLILFNSNTSTKIKPCTNEASIEVLRQRMNSINTEFDCIENPSDLVHLYCMDYPQDDVCSVFSHIANSAIKLTTKSLCTLLLTLVLGTV